MTKWNRDTTWRQGQVLSRDTAKQLGLRHHANPDKTLVIVASHDCDLAQVAEREPSVEMIIGCLLDQQDGNFTHAKVPRKLHLSFEAPGQCVAEFEAIHKMSIPKETLGEFLPDAEISLSPASISTFQFWLGSRYRRSAFPDEFERRLKVEKLDEKISKVLKPHGELISGIFFDVDEGKECDHDGPDDPYSLDIYLLYPDEPDYMASASAAKQSAQTIYNAFADKLYKPTHTWRQIELGACEAVSESVLTYARFKQLRRWRLDYISLANDPQHPVLAE